MPSVPDLTFVLFPSADGIQLDKAVDALRRRRVFNLNYFLNLLTRLGSVELEILLLSLGYKGSIPKRLFNKAPSAQGPETTLVLSSPTTGNHGNRSRSRE